MALSKTTTSPLTIDALRVYQFRFKWPGRLKKCSCEDIAMNWQKYLRLPEDYTLAQLNDHIQTYQQKIQGRPRVLRTFYSWALRICYKRYKKIESQQLYYHIKRFVELDQAELPPGISIDEHRERILKSKQESQNYLINHKQLKKFFQASLKRGKKKMSRTDKKQAKKNARRIKAFEKKCRAFLAKTNNILRLHESVTFSADYKVSFGGGNISLADFLSEKKPTVPLGLEKTCDELRENAERFKKEYNSECEYYSKLLPKSEIYTAGLGKITAKYTQSLRDHQEIADPLYLHQTEMQKIEKEQKQDNEQQLRDFKKECQAFLAITKTILASYEESTASTAATQASSEKRKDSTALILLRQGVGKKSKQKSISLPKIRDTYKKLEANAKRFAKKYVELCKHYQAMPSSSKNYAVGLKEIIRLYDTSLISHQNKARAFYSQYQEMLKVEEQQKREMEGGEERERKAQQKLLEQKQKKALLDSAKIEAFKIPPEKTSFKETLRLFKAHIQKGLNKLKSIKGQAEYSIISDQISKECRKVFKELSRKYHPDKVASRIEPGLSAQAKKDKVGALKKIAHNQQADLINLITQQINAITSGSLKLDEEKEKGKKKKRSKQTTDGLTDESFEKMMERIPEEDRPPLREIYEGIKEGREEREKEEEREKKVDAKDLRELKDMQVEVQCLIQQARRQKLGINPLAADSPCLSEVTSGPDKPTFG